MKATFTLGVPYPGYRLIRAIDNDAMKNLSLLGTVNLAER
ncbi:hypothetical protein QF026_008563 [Streptomyces aurantiacus]|nr:hypothetical protein [Streptomyces aurantiacus]